MARREDLNAALTDPRVRTGGTPPVREGTGAYHPSRTFRVLLGRAARAGGEATPEPSAVGGPAVSTVIASAVVVGVVAGFLELAVLTTQVQVLHRVGMSTLRISRHVAWMVPVAETMLTLALTLLFTTPLLAWAAWRSRRKPQVGAFAWGWTGAVLGTLVWLGPLLAIRGLHVTAALALATGAGFRLRHWVLRPSAGWRRGVIRGAVVAVGGLACYGHFQWDRVERAEARAWSRPAAPKPAPNLIWIVMDTVRADRMGLYGYDRPTTPELDRWAKLGLTFDQARSAAPWTLPSHLSMFTGLWPFEHGARIDRPYTGPAPTLAEHLAARGYTTAGFVANTGMCNAAYGVGRGFDHYVDFPDSHDASLRATVLNSSLGAWTLWTARRIGVPVADQLPPKARRRAPEVIDEAQGWLDRVQYRNERGDEPPDASRPFFLFLNFMDAHSPYLPLPNQPRVFWTDPVPPRRLTVPRNGWVAVEARNAAAPEARPQFDRELDEVTRRLSDLYDECLHGLDAELGRFLDDLRAEGLLENSWVVITADHGEHFGEHDLFGHGGSLYDELTHIPLVLIPPIGPSDRHTENNPADALRGRRVAVPVSHRDLARTLADLLLPGGDNPFPGRSLARHWDVDGPEAPDPILAQLEQQHLEGEEVQSDLVVTKDALIDEGHLLIRSSDRDPELYELASDRRQQRDLAGRPGARDLQARLGRTLDAILGRTR